MKVLVVAEQLAMPHTGIGRYTIDLLHALGRESSIDASVLCTRSGVGAAERAGIPQRNIHLLSDSLAHRSMTVLRGGHAVFRRTDLTHGTKHFIPLQGTPAVLTVHDLVAFRLQGDPRTLARTVAYRQSLRRASLLAPTNHTVADGLASCLGEHSPRRFIYMPPPVNVRAGRRPPELDPGPFVLHVSDLDQRKNLGHLLEIWPSVHMHTGCRLVLAGARHERSRWSREIAMLEHQGLAIDLGPVSDGTLFWLYDNARLLVFPSLCEGFGYPVVEALSRGCPVVASPVPAAIEARTSDLLTMAPADDRRAWRDLVMTLAGQQRSACQNGSSATGQGSLRAMYQSVVR